MQQNRHRAFGARTALASLLAILFVFGLGLSRSKPRRVQLADGRIFQVEAVIFGTNQCVGWQGWHHPLSRFVPAWLDTTPHHIFPLLRPGSQMVLKQPALMVWVTASNPTTGTNVDCGEVRMELKDNQGALYPGFCWSSRGGGGFWRRGYSFPVFPRDQKHFTLQITPWSTNQSARIDIANPHVTAPATWLGSSLPQTKTVGTMEIAIVGLILRTNGTAGDDWQIAWKYWEPVWELRQASHPAVGWDVPEWNAEDAVGNRNRMLGVHQPVIRFDAKFYPSATNFQAAVQIGRSPPTALGTLQTNVWWNIEIPYRGHTIAVLGLFPPGEHIFSEGTYVTNGIQGINTGSLSGRLGWSGNGRSLSPGKFQTWAHHRTAVPTIYLRVSELDEDEHLGVRILDEEGRYWPTRLQANGTDMERAYLLDVPADAKTVVAEIVVLKPVQADFFVSTGSRRDR